MGRGDFEIIIKVDKDNRTITVSDNGCGMNAEQLESNLGTIAHSGTLRFKTSEEKLDDMDLIGQFGIGFYAAFMVSEKVTVTSLAYGEDQAYRWESTGVDGYTIEPCKKNESAPILCFCLRTIPKMRAMMSSWINTGSQHLSKNTPTISAIRSRWRWKKPA